MKKILFITLSVMLLFTSCSKDETEETRPIVKVINQTTCKHNVYLESSFLGSVDSAETKEFELPLVVSGSIQSRKTVKAVQDCDDTNFEDVTMWEFYENGETYQLLIN